MGVERPLLELRIREGVVATESVEHAHGAVSSRVVTRSCLFSSRPRMKLSCCLLGFAHNAHPNPPRYFRSPPFKGESEFFGCFSSAFGCLFLSASAHFNCCSTMFAGK